MAAWSFLPNGANLLRLAHETSQNLIRICQFVTILLKEDMIILKISAHYDVRIRGEITLQKVSKVRLKTLKMEVESKYT